jgi:hypothetical protein
MEIDSILSEMKQGKNLITFLKGKVNFSLYLTKHYAMKKYDRSGGATPRILELST